MYPELNKLFLKSYFGFSCTLPLLLRAMSPKLNCAKARMFSTATQILLLSY